MNKVNVNFGEKTKKVKAVNSVCLAPYVKNTGEKQPLMDKLFAEAKFPFCRLHDCQGAYGGTYYVDISNIFRDFDADENDPASYDFYYTDEYISAIHHAGSQAYYRLGETIEWGSKKYRTLPPRDNKKWARIAEHIIRHYNEGWADGFNYGIRYWEIWNEPENPPNSFGSSMFNGTKEQYFALYETAAKHLKACFPQIKIGGYGSCGFYPVTREKVWPGWESFVPYFHEFLAMAKETGTPLDFFSWHIYTADIDELLEHARYARKTLDDAGFTDTEAHLNEWNIHSEGAGFLAKHTIEGASFNAAVMAALQNEDTVDVACYYCFQGHAMYNGLLNQNDHSVDPPFYSFVAFGKLYEKGMGVLSNATGVYATAAADETGGAVIISNYNTAEDETQLSFSNAPGSEVQISILSDERGLVPVFKCAVPESGSVSFSLPERTVALVEFKN